MRVHFFLMGLLAGLIIGLSVPCWGGAKAACMTGAFLRDHPTGKDIEQFKRDYGKKPYLVLVFIDWECFVDERVFSDVNSADCALVVTWEPWYAIEKKGIDFTGLLAGKYDSYIRRFAQQLRDSKREVFLRFGHEMNGDWYPWSVEKLGKEKFVAVYRRVKDLFDEEGVKNVKWIFSLNAEDVPKRKDGFMAYYPGDAYVDYVGIDGYNWGNTKHWSQWMSFGEIFRGKYGEISSHLEKPILITEFSSTSRGGDKGAWIDQAMKDIEEMPKIKGFILFNDDKEADWSFSVRDSAGKELKKRLSKDCFKDFRVP